MIGREFHRTLLAYVNQVFQQVSGKTIYPIVLHDYWE